MVAVVWFAALRPVSLGGTVSYIVVHGSSMGGTLAPGDLAITRSQGGYSIGDAIVYHVPEGAGKGRLVVHRIVGADAAGYRMQGDANSHQDPWQPKGSDVVGRLVLTLPGFGSGLASLANPLVLAAVWAFAAFFIGLSFLPNSPAATRQLVLNPRLPARRDRVHLAALEFTAGFRTSFLVGLAGVSAVVVVYSPWTVVVAVVAATVALFVGLSFRPNSSIARPRFLTNRRARRQRGGDHPLVDVLAASALSVMVGLVILSSEAFISPANATSLTIGNAPVSAWVMQCPPAHPTTGTCT